MSDSSPVPKVYAAMSAVQSTLAENGISKNRENTQQKFMFRGIDDIYNFLANSLAREKLLIIPRVINRSVTERETKVGGALFSVVVEMEFDFVCAIDGSKVTARMFGEAMDSGDKATNKAESAAYKYVCLQTFCIPTEGMHEDADQTTQPTLKPGPNAQPAKAAAPAPAAAATPAKATPAKTPAKPAEPAPKAAPAQVVDKVPPGAKAAPKATEPAKATAPAKPAGGITIPDWREVKVHFGKRNGVALGELEEASLLWFIQKWDPNNKAAGYPPSDQDAVLRKALDLAGASMALPGFGVPDMQEDVPYDDNDETPDPGL